MDTTHPRGYSSRVHTRAKLGAAFCYVVLFAHFVAALCGHICALGMLLAFVMVFISDTTIWAWLLIVGFEYWRLFFIPSALPDSASSLSLSDFRVRLIAPELAETIRDLCKQRSIAEPRVVVETTFEVGRSAHAAIFNPLVGERVLILSALMLHHLTSAQRRAVISHELRHQGATSVIFRWFSVAIDGVFSRIWLYCVTFFLIYQGISLIAGHPNTPSAWMTIWKIGTSFLCFCLAKIFAAYCRGAMNRADEHKTDILACLDTGEHEQLIFALQNIRKEDEKRQKHIQAIMEESERESGLEISVDKHAPMPRAKKLLLVTLDGILCLILRAVSFFHKLNRSHPSPDKRQRMLTQIFGPLRFDETETDNHRGSSSTFIFLEVVKKEG